MNICIYKILKLFSWPLELLNSHPPTNTPKLCAQTHIIVYFVSCWVVNLLRRKIIRLILVVINFLRVINQRSTVSKYYCFACLFLLLPRFDGRPLKCCYRRPASKQTYSLTWRHIRIHTDVFSHLHIFMSFYLCTCVRHSQFFCIALWITCLLLFPFRLCLGYVKYIHVCRLL